ncbi:hypothetical protein BDR03DRAFT_1017659 [Suillus americanus]|nr:hypothetical protein BDR03DRAFT_1017659 [Suillus americanus]
MPSTVVHVHAAHAAESKKLGPTVGFINRNIKAGFPPNTFLFVDTHSDEYTGMLQHTGGHSGGTNTTITEILMAYLGHDFIKSMTLSLDAARSDKTVSRMANGTAPSLRILASVDAPTSVVVFATTVDNRRVAECRQIAKDIPGLCTFGYEFKSCPTSGCQPAPADMRVHNHGVKVHLRCLKCNWRSASAKTDADNKHFKRVNKLVAP